MVLMINKFMLISSNAHKANSSGVAEHQKFYGIIVTGSNAHKDNSSRVAEHLKFNGIVALSDYSSVDHE